MLNLFGKNRRFKLKGTCPCRRPIDEMSAIDKNEADSAFKSCKKQYLDTLLSSKGFLKYETNSYIRRNQVDVLERIELQKGRYGAKTFTVNCALTPLYLQYDCLNFCVDERIGTLVCDKDVWWDFANESIAKVSFENVANAIEEFVLPWFDSLSNDASIKKMLQRKKRNDWLSRPMQSWLELIDNHSDCSATIAENIKLFGLPEKKHMIVKEILYNIDENIYCGLNVIFKLDDNRNLLFDSARFSFVDHFNLLNKRWKHFPLCVDQLEIAGIYEDEIAAYFVLFSNGYIFFIDKVMTGYGKIELEFSLVLPSDSNYKEVLSYMNEDWIDVWYSKSDSIDRIRR